MSTLRWESGITGKLFATGAKTCVSVPGSFNVIGLKGNVTESTAVWARLLAPPKLDVPAAVREVEESSEVVGGSDEDNDEIDDGGKIDLSGCEARICVGACSSPLLADAAAPESDCALCTGFCNGALTRLFVRAAAVVIPGATI